MFYRHIGVIKLHMESMLDNRNAILLLTVLLVLSIFAGSYLIFSDTEEDIEINLPESSLQFQEDIDQQELPEQVEINVTGEIKNVKVDENMIAWTEGYEVLEEIEGDRLGSDEETLTRKSTYFNRTVFYHIPSDETREVEFEHEIIEFELGDDRGVWRLREREDTDKFGLAEYNWQEDEWRDSNRDFPEYSRKTQMSISGDWLVWTDLERQRGQIDYTDRSIFLLDLVEREEERLSEADGSWQLTPDIDGNKIVWVNWETPITQGGSVSNIVVHDLESLETEQITDTFERYRNPEILENMVKWQSMDACYIYDLDESERKMVYEENSNEFRGCQLSKGSVLVLKNNEIVRKDYNGETEEVIFEIQDKRISSMNVGENYVGFQLTGGLTLDNITQQDQEQLELRNESDQQQEPLEINERDRGTELRAIKLD